MMLILRFSVKSDIVLKRDVFPFFDPVFGTIVWSFCVFEKDCFKSEGGNNVVEVKLSKKKKKHAFFLWFPDRFVNINFFQASNGRLFIFFVPKAGKKTMKTKQKREIRKKCEEWCQNYCFNMERYGEVAKKNRLIYDGVQLFVCDVLKGIRKKKLWKVKLRKKKRGV